MGRTVTSVTATGSKRSRAGIAFGTRCGPRGLSRQRMTGRTTPRRRRSSRKCRGFKLCGRRTHARERSTKSGGPDSAQRDRRECKRCGKLVTITPFIGRTRRRTAGFPKHFKPFAWAGLSLTGTGVGLSHGVAGESGEHSRRSGRQSRRNGGGSRWGRRPSRLPRESDGLGGGVLA